MMQKSVVHIMISADKSGKSLKVNIKNATLSIGILMGLMIIMIGTVCLWSKWENVNLQLAEYKTRLQKYIELEQNLPSTEDTHMEEIEAYIAKIQKLEQALEEKEEDKKSIQKSYEVLQREYDSLKFFEDKMAYVPTYTPTNGVITSNFGSRTDPMTGGGVEVHKGIDIGANYGDPIWAAAKGVVLEAESVNGYGKMVLIDHGDGTKTRYAHASKLLVEEGDMVEKGEEIAEIGSTGNSTGPHLHFEWIEDEKQVNPIKLFAEGGDS